MRSPGKPGYSPDHNSPARMVEQNLADYWLSFGACPGGEISASGNVTWEYSGTPFFNRVVHAYFDHHDSDSRIHDIMGAFRNRRAAITWLVGPSSAPHDLGARLEHSGFTRVDTWIGMVHSLDRQSYAPTRPDELIVKTVTDDVTCDDWSRVVRSSFGLPRRTGAILTKHFRLTQDSDTEQWINLVAYRRSVPVAAVTLLVTQKCAGIYLVSTIPGARRNGLGSYMTWLALERARELGCQNVVLQASAEGRQIYERLGFTPVCRFGVYRLPAPRPRWKRAAMVLARRLLANFVPRSRSRGRTSFDRPVTSPNGRSLPAVSQCVRSHDI